MTNHHTADRRVRRTRGRLHEALASLIHEKPYDDIVVKEILARADVGRTTFYAHFRDKEELLLSATRELLHAGETGGPAHPVDPADRVLRFGRTLLEHMEHVRRGGTTLDARRHTALHERLRPMLVAVVTDALRTARSSRDELGDDLRPHLPVELLARHVADTFLRVLAWWVEDGGRRGAAEVDEIFRALVRPAVSAR